MVDVSRSLLVSLHLLIYLRHATVSNGAVLAAVQEAAGTPVTAAGASEITAAPIAAVEKEVPAGVLAQDMRVKLPAEPATPLTTPLTLAKPGSATADSPDLLTTDSPVPFEKNVSTPTTAAPADEDAAAGAPHTAADYGTAAADFDEHAADDISERTEAADAAAEVDGRGLPVAFADNDTPSEHAADDVESAAAAAVKTITTGAASLPLCKDRTRGLAFEVRNPTSASVFGCAASHSTIDPPVDDQVYRYHEGVCSGPQSIASFIPGASLRKNVARSEVSVADAAVSGEAAVTGSFSAHEAAVVALEDSMHVLAVPQLQEKAETICLLCLPQKPPEAEGTATKKDETAREDEVEAPPEQGCLILVTVHHVHAAAVDEADAVESDTNSAENIVLTETEDTVQQEILTLHDCTGGEQAAGGVATLEAALLPHAPVRFVCGENESHTLLPMQPSLVYDDSDGDCDASLPASAADAIASAATARDEEQVQQRERLQRKREERMQERQFYLDDPMEPMSVVVEYLRDLVPSATLTVGPYSAPEELAEATGDSAAQQIASTGAGAAKVAAPAADTRRTEGGEGKSRKVVHTLSIRDLPAERKKICYRCRRNSPIYSAPSTARRAAGHVISSGNKFSASTGSGASGASRGAEAINECRLRITIPSAAEVRAAIVAAEQEEAESGTRLLLQEPQRKFVLPY